jgi:hypothetical protein
VFTMVSSASDIVLCIQLVGISKASLGFFLDYTTDYPRREWAN